MAHGKSSVDKKLHLALKDFESSPCLRVGGHIHLKPPIPPQNRSGRFPSACKHDDMFVFAKTQTKYDLPNYGSCSLFCQLPTLKKQRVRPPAASSGPSELPWAWCRFEDLEPTQQLPTLAYSIMQETLKNAYNSQKFEGKNMKNTSPKTPTHKRNSWKGPTNAPSHSSSSFFSVLMRGAWRWKSTKMPQAGVCSEKSSLSFGSVSLFTLLTFDFVFSFFSFWKVGSDQSKIYVTMYRENLLWHMPYARTCVQCWHLSLGLWPNKKTNRVFASKVSGHSTLHTLPIAQFVLKELRKDFLRKGYQISHTKHVEFAKLLCD